jgi:hypothetical protein
MQDMHAQEFMYEAVQVAYAPADPSATAAAAACLLSSTGSSLSAAAAGLGVAQQAAALGLPHVQLDTPAGISTSPYAAASATESGLPGLAKTLAAETGLAVLLQQQEAAVPRIALQTQHVKGQQPVFREINSRWVGRLVVPLHLAAFTICFTTPPCSTCCLSRQLPEAC